jgi:hypothetical protein
MVITLRPNLQLGQGEKKTCSSCWELSNGVSHSTYMHRGWVDSWLLMIGSQIANLTPDLSFCHNLCCRCPNGLCEPIFNIYSFIAFQWYKEHINARCFDPYNRILKFWESQWTPKSPFWECESHFPILPTVGLRQSNKLIRVMEFICWALVKNCLSMCLKATLTPTLALTAVEARLVIKSR